MKTINPWTSSDAAFMRAGQRHDDRLLGAYLDSVDDSEQPQTGTPEPINRSEYVRLCDMRSENVTLTDAGHVDIPAFLRGV